MSRWILAVALIAALGIAGAAVLPLAGGAPAGEERDRETPEQRLSWTAEQILLVSLAVLLVAIGTLVQENVRRRRAQRELRRREAGLRAILETAADAIITIDERGIIQSFNPAAERLFGYPATEMMGQNVSQLMPPPFSEEHNSYIARYLTTGIRKVIGIGRQVQGRRKDGAVFPIDLSVSEVDLPGQRLFTAIARDVSDRLAAAEALRRANEELSIEVRESEQRTREISLLGQMGALLQAALTEEEAHAIVADFARRLLPGDSGALGVAQSAKNTVELVATWGGSPVGERLFAPDECWALRGGRIHKVDDPAAGTVCAHLRGIPPVGYVCVPLMAQGDALGIFHLQWAAPADSGGSPARRALASRLDLVTAMAEQSAMAIGSLRLKETLRGQAIRDPLTGLYNRRYLEEALERELRRAQRQKVPVGVLMLDLDRFKTFNDAHGHAAGDALLRAFSTFLQSSVRLEDIACRYGGEEFALILPNAPFEHATVRAEQIRHGAQQIRVEFHGKTLSTVTVSVGVAAMPNHGDTPDRLLRAADAALYAAKADGRNCVRSATGAVP
jgi:diguanylate cyclase (GGDEF)-like protein/PAS domain S-box-containing protein